MSKRIAIVQSSYIPWKGYFDLLRAVDEFVLYDDMQYTKRDWRNRNQIKTAQGLQWLSVPVEVKGRFHQPICETRIAEPGWAEHHWRSLQHAYAKAPHFAAHRDVVKASYDKASSFTGLSLVNHELMRMIAGLLGIGTKITWSMDYPQREGKSDRLLSICQAAGADFYLSGPSARDYLDVALFEANGVQVAFADYAGYPEYPQLHGPFEHAVTALDLIFNVGAADAQRFMKAVA